MQRGASQRRCDTAVRLGVAAGILVPDAPVPLAGTAANSCSDSKESMADAVGLSRASSPSSLGVPTPARAAPLAAVHFMEATFSKAQERVFQRSARPACKAFLARLLAAVTVHLLRQAEMEAEAHVKLQKDFIAVKEQSKDRAAMLLGRNASQHKAPRSLVLDGKAVGDGRKATGGSTARRHDSSGSPESLPAHEVD